MKSNTNGHPDIILGLYLNEIGKFALLNADEEVDLARKIRKGGRAGRRACNKMINANLRLVVSIARSADGKGVPLLDLINEGNIGLMKAVTRFDPAKGGRFSSYGAWWIEQKIQAHIVDTARTIRVPVSAIDEMGYMRKASMRLAQEFGREPTDAEISQELGMPLKKVSALRRATDGTISLDALKDADAMSDSPHETIEDENAEMPSRSAERACAYETLHEFLGRLPERTRKILRRRFGFTYGKDQTFENIGRSFRLTKTRIRQIQMSAFEQLRVWLTEVGITRGSTYDT